MENILSDRSAFRLKSPLITSNGAASDTHPQITDALAELNKLLSKRVFITEGWEGSDSFDWRKMEEVADAARAAAARAERVSDAVSDEDPESPDAVKAEKHSASALKAAAKAEERAAKALEQAAVAPEDDGIDVGSFLLLRLKPRRAGHDDDTWQKWSLADVLSDRQSSSAYATLSEVIDLYPTLSELNAELLGVLHEKRFKLPDVTRTILADDYPAIRDYLVLYGASQPGIDDIDGLANFVFYASRGAARIADYAIVSAAREIVKRKALNVPDYNDDEGLFVADIRSAAQAGQLPLSQTAFDRGVLRVGNRQIFGVDERELFAKAHVGELPEALQEQVIQRMGAWPGTITEANVDMVVNSLLAQIQGPGGDDAEEDEEAPETSPDDFKVSFFDDSVDDVLISRSSVLCAAQLFHAVVAGDELDAFGAVDYFTHRYLLRGGIEIRDRRLRADLQRYVFSNRFTDVDTGVENERTRAPERQMFARQVFAMGNSQVTDDMIVNAEFPRLWKVLMLESAKYLEYARESFNADAYVSRQGVMQAVEDLQYNLSTHCTGMVTVLTPLMDAELQFVVRRILSHAEVRRQVVPAGGSWKRVVERLNMEGKHRSANATVLYNKAKLGQMIIEAVSEYDPAEFETDGPFSSFISSVDRFITTQSILQDVQSEGPPDAQPEEPSGYAPPSMTPGGSGMPAPPPVAVNGNGAAHNGAAADEWDF